MNSIQSPSFPKEKKRFLLPFLLCSLAVTSVALGGTSLIRFRWLDNYHPYTNSAGAAVLEAEWVIYPNGLPPGAPPPGGQGNDFYLTATTPHQVDGGEILFRYSPWGNYFGLTDYCPPESPCPEHLYTSLENIPPQYIGMKVVNGQSLQVMKYRLSNIRTTGSKVKLTCNNRSATIAAASNGAALPQPIIYVDSGRAFPTSGSVQVVSSTGGQLINYTGTTTNGSGYTTSFTGCTGGLGILTTGNGLAEFSGNSSTGTHFQNTMYLFNYISGNWDLWYDHQFNHTALLHDCTSCGGVCGYWGPMFESNPIYFPGPPPSWGGCMLGYLPQIGVVDMRVSVDYGPFFVGNTMQSVFELNLNDCTPGQNPPYQLVSHLPNYQWIIKSVPND